MVFMDKTKYAPILTVIIIFLSGASTTWFFLRPEPAIDLSETCLSNQELEHAKYPLLSKRIFVENPNDNIINFIPLRAAMNEYAKELPEETGIYFEYLPTGTSIGVNEKMEINLASLVKIPLVMGVYRQIEKGQLRREDVLTIHKDDLDKGFGDLWKKGVGTTLTVEEAVRLALVNSDNTASNVLRSTIPPQTIDLVFDSLDIPKDLNGTLHIISPKNYSSILRSLYLSSYLKEESSNEILDILTQTIYADKIAAGVPKDVGVAHKIGVFSSKKQAEETFSDCGIVYAPQKPYLLCIMTKSNEERAREIMKTFSKMIYEYITVTK